MNGDLIIFVVVIKTIVIKRHIVQYIVGNLENIEEGYEKEGWDLEHQKVSMGIKSKKIVLSLEEDFFCERVEIIYMKIISIPPKKAKIKIKEIQGFLVCIHFIVIIVRVSSKMEGISIFLDREIIRPKDVVISKAKEIIQNLV